jgi:hypothetical protein
VWAEPAGGRVSCGCSNPICGAGADLRGFARRICGRTARTGGVIGTLPAPFLLTVPADLVVLNISVELTGVIFPAALLLTIGQVAEKLLGMMAGKLKQLLALATTAIAHLAAPNRDSSRPLVLTKASDLTNKSALHWSIGCGRGKRNDIAESRTGSGQDCELYNLGGNHSTRCLRPINRLVRSFELPRANRFGGVDAGLRVGVQRALGDRRYDHRHGALARPAATLLDSILRERPFGVYVLSHLPDALWAVPIANELR